MSSFIEKVIFAVRTYSRSYQAVKIQNNRDKISDIQNARLSKLINYCYNNVKYYHELFEQHGIKPDDIKTASDISHIPLLTRQTLRERFWDFLPRQLPPCRVSRTSGSTGVPICLLSDNNSRLHNSAAVIRYRLAAGIGFIGKPILTPLKTKTEPRKLPHWTFLQGIHKTYYINPYSEEKTEIEYAAGVVKKIKQPAIIGITPAVKAIADRIRDDILPPIKPSAVLTIGERLSYQIRQLLENTFGIKVTDIYACNEAGDVAWQCRNAQGYHINCDNCIVEILNDGAPAQPGQTGEVVITNLNRYCMPIIRYKNGDLAKFSQQKCDCGCELPMLSEIVGRTGEDIILPDGKIIPWNVLKSAMNHNQIRQFQLIQNHNGSVTAKYVPEQNANTKDIEKLLKFRFSRLLPAPADFNFEIVEKIEPSPSGKSKLVISNYFPENK